MRYSIDDLEKDYELELDRIVKEIEKEKAESVLLQLPDGLKPYVLAISDYLEEKTSAKVSIWLGACFGACDLPDSDADLVIQFGHSPWK
ncbi:hypothetical protein HN935_02700 [archaeon]|jgi:diphthamide biosynthesis enzyme Dph1/Dph2-like protein|nr:hypothetical protein [archaeon]